MHSMHSVVVLGGCHGAMAPGPALFVTQKGPRVQEKIEKRLSNKGPADDLALGPAIPKTATACIYSNV